MRYPPLDPAAVQSLADQFTCAALEDAKVGRHYVEALVYVNAAMSCPGITDAERLTRVRTVLAAFAAANTAHEVE